MNNPSKAVTEIKNLLTQFGFLKAEEPAKVSFKLEDNTILNTVKLEAGNKISKINIILLIFFKYHNTYKFFQLILRFATSLKYGNIQGLNLKFLILMISLGL